MTRNRIGLCFFAAAVLSGQSSGPALELRFAAYQTGCPVAITYLKTSGGFPFGQIRLKNLGDKSVSAITLGILLSPLDRNGAVIPDRVLIRSTSVPLTGFEAGQSVELNDLERHFRSFATSLFSIPTSKADANLGVLSITFADGMEWVSTVPTTLQFSTPTNFGAAAQCKLERHLLASTGVAFILAGHMECQYDTKSPTTCDVTGGGTSCSMLPCSCAPGGCNCGQNCPCRKCVYVP